MQHQLNIAGIASVTLNEMPDQTFRPFGADFYRDLFSLYQLPLTVEAMGKGKFSTFEGLCVQAIEKLGGKEALAGVDLLILAHYLPNTIAYHSTTSFLLERYGLNAFAFAVSDQEKGASFTALDLAQDYFATGGAKKALLITVEQSTLPMEVPWPKVGELKDTAVALLLEAGEGTKILATGAVPYTHALELKTALLAQAKVPAEDVALLSENNLSPDSAVSAFWLAMEKWMKEGTQPYLLALQEGCGRSRGFLLKRPE